MIKDEELKTYTLDQLNKLKDRVSHEIIRRVSMSVPYECSNGNHTPSKKGKNYCERCKGVIYPQFPSMLITTKLPFHFNSGLTENDDNTISSFVIDDIQKGTDENYIVSFSYKGKCPNQEKPFEVLFSDKEGHNIGVVVFPCEKGVFKKTLSYNIPFIKKGVVYTLQLGEN